MLQVNEILHQIQEREPPGPLKPEEKTARLPLVRLRVDHTGFPKLSVQRFGQPFVGKIANADEILSFHKQKKISERKSKGSSASGAAGAAAGGGDEEEEGDLLSRGAEVDEAPPIHDLVINIIEKENPLTILSPAQITDAVREYVEKHEPNAIESATDDFLKKLQIELKSDNALVNKVRRLCLCCVAILIDFDCFRDVVVCGLWLWFVVDRTTSKR